MHTLAAGSDPVLTITEAEDFLGVSGPYLTRLRKTGKLAYRTKSNRHLVAVAALEPSTCEPDRRLDELVALAAAAENRGLRWAALTTRSSPCATPSAVSAGMT